jgi:putative transposase
MDEQYMKTPFYGSRKYVVFLRSLGYEINRKRVMRLMKKLGLQAIYPKRRTTVANPKH